MSVQQIGIAVVEAHQRWLVGERGADSSLAGMAEFPGGKCRPGERPARCAERECAEETGLRVEARRLLHEQRFDYEHASVHLHFWLCQLADSPRSDDEPELPTPAGAFRWVDQSTLATLKFPPANATLLERLLDG